MSLRSLEIEITCEARRHFNNSKLRLKDLMEWYSAEIKPQDGEVVEFLPAYRVWVAVSSKHDKRLPPIPQGDAP